ncbi:hypothetical protein AVEN_84103-1 [Araneus ventricosus]|uniref:Integrase zinc-binding domain-containing protein n=1 Tax=Araneus ventricosus TaxID=182803 RepID=A0A4Y2J7T8_ARAVE|nr:hypothetical protein AVEN_84103-1 [Araneus ventricosus]
MKVLTPTTVDPWTSSEIQKAQLEDPTIKPIPEKKLNSADRPSWQEIAPESPSTKRFWALWDSLHLKDGVLYRNASGGHFGVMKILSKTPERFYSDRHRVGIKKWCRECHARGARKGPKTRTKGRLQGYNVGPSFERMVLEILGPFPVTTKDN